MILTEFFIFNIYENIFHLFDLDMIIFLELESSKIVTKTVCNPLTYG